MSKKSEYYRKEEARRFNAATDAKRRWLEATIVGPSTTLPVLMVPDAKAPPDLTTRIKVCRQGKPSCNF